MRRLPLGPLSVVVSTVASDSHSWNLVYLQLLIEEMGHSVLNLGPCAPEELVQLSLGYADLLVVSSVNGHGFQDGLRLIRRIRSAGGLFDKPVVIGGKLGTNGFDGGRRAQMLRCAGYDEVFENPSAPADFSRFLTRLALDPRRRVNMEHHLSSTDGCVGSPRRMDFG